MSESGGGLPGASPTYGGSGGNPFSDQPPEGSRICRVHVRHGEYVDGISLAWIEPDGTFVEGPFHGRKKGGTEDSFTLEPGDLIQVVRGASGEFVDSLSFQTSLGRSYGPYGGSGGNPFEENFGAEPNPLDRSPGAAVIHPVIGIFGRSGQLLDAIGFWIDVDFVTGN